MNAGKPVHVFQFCGDNKSLYSGSGHYLQQGRCKSENCAVLQIVFLGVAKGKKSFWQLSAPVAEPRVVRWGGRVWVWGVSPEKIFVEFTPNGAILHTFEAMLLSDEIFQLPSAILSCQKKCCQLPICNTVVCTQNSPPPSELTRYVFAPPSDPAYWNFAPGLTLTCKFTWS